jgi:predicted cupin superfamily sugar epimerase
MTNATDVIRALNLQPHPLEGGFFNETYRSVATVQDGTRSMNTAIYYLLTGAGVSEMHRLPGDEIYHWYAGNPLETLLLNPTTGHAEMVVLGNDVAAGQRPQLVIPGGTWQGSCRGAGPFDFTLIGATMSPGFDPADYVRGGRVDLTETFPQYAEEILKRTPHG